jgi:transcriptional regulator with XRE-family HTH domain
VEIGGRIRTRRDALGLTQHELADEVGVTPQHVSRLESDLNAPSLDLLVKLANSLGVTTDFLLTGKEVAKIDVKGAIRSETTISAKSKRLLIDLIGELGQPD